MSEKNEKKNNEEPEEPFEEPGFEAPFDLSAAGTELAQELSSGEDIDIRRFSDISKVERTVLSGLLAFDVAKRGLNSRSVRRQFIEQYLNLSISIGRQGRREALNGLQFISGPVQQPLEGSEKISRWGRLKQFFSGGE